MTETPSPQALASLHLRRATALLDVGRWHDAVTALHESLKLDPESTETHCHLALAQLRGGRFKDAIAAADEAIARDPNAEWPHRIRSAAARHLGAYESALQYASAAHRLAPDVWQTAHCVANALYHLRRYGQAREMAEVARSLAPDQPDPHNLLGLIALGGRQLLEAETQFRQALRTDARNAEAHKHLGTVLMRQGRLAEAVSFFGSSLAVNPTDHAARDSLGHGARSLRKQTILLSSRRLFERISPATYQYYLEIEGRSSRVLLLTFLWKVFAPVTTVLALIAMLLRWLLGEIDLGGFVIADLALNGFLLVAMTLFRWKRDYLRASDNQVRHMSTITAIVASPLTLVVAGVAGLIYDESRWVLYMLVAICGCSLSIKLATRRARGIIYRVASRWYRDPQDW